MSRFEKVRFNDEHYKKVHRAHGISAKEGLFDVTVHPNGLYCFATGDHLGINGRLKDSPMIGTKWHKRDKPGKAYVVDGVNIHYYSCGYYYVATFRDEADSHALLFIKNINCKDKTVLDGIRSFKYDWVQIK